jgi:hypothetical protein
MKDGVARVRRLGPEDEKIFREWREKTVYRIGRLDPAYETPEVLMARSYDRITRWI